MIDDGAPELDWITALFKYSHLLGVVPSLSDENVVGSSDFIGVEDVARDLVKTALDYAHPIQRDPITTYLGLSTIAVLRRLLQIPSKTTWKRWPGITSLL